MRTSNQTNFLKSLPIVAGCLGEKLGVKVQFGDIACTDGKAITVPTFIDEREISREEMLGYIVHESSHIRYTEMGLFLNNISPLQKHFINAIEDARIEKLIAKEYAGARYLLNAAHEPMLKGFLDSSRLNPQSALSLYLLAQCETTYVTNQLLHDVRDALKDRCLKCFGAPLMADVDAELAIFPMLGSTADVAKLAERIMKLLVDQLPPEERPAQPGEESQDEEGQEQGNASQETNAQNSPSEGTSGNGESSSAETDSAESSDSASSGSDSEKKSSSDSSDSSGSNTGSGTDSSSTSSSSDSGKDSSGSGCSGSSSESSQDSGEEEEEGAGNHGSKLTDKQAAAVKKALEATEKSIKSADLSNLKNRITEAADDDNQSSWFGETDIKAPSKAKPSCGVLQNSRGLDRLAQAKATSVKARRALSGIVQAKTRCRAYTANSGRRLQVSKLARLATGSTHVFERRDEAKGVDTAVSVLLDLSGSVGGDANTAIRASLALKLALETIPKVSSCLTVFPAEACRLKSGECEPCIQVVPFGERSDWYANAIGKLASNGNTPLAPTLLRTAVELSQRREAKKVVIVITDGVIDSEAVLMLKRFAGSGITLAGIGIGIDRCSRNRFQENFAIHAFVNDFENLQEVLMEIATQIMIEDLH